MVRTFGWMLGGLVAGCGVFPPVSCTLIGCDSSLVLGVADAGTLDRDIDVTMTFGDETLVCTGTLDAVEGLFCPDLSVRPIDGGYEIAPNVDFEEAADVHLVVSRDGAVVFDDDVEVVWGEPFAPNGEACGPICISGEAQISVEQ